MQISKTFNIPNAVLAGLLLFPPQMFAAGATPEMSRTVLMEKPVDLGGSHISTKTIRVNFPPSFKTPWHTHEGPGPRYVVKGKLKVIDGGKTTVYQAGDVFWETGELMSVENISAQPAEIIIVELVHVKD